MNWTPEELTTWSQKATEMFLHAQEQSWKAWCTDKHRYWIKRREFWRDRTLELRKIENKETT